MCRSYFAGWLINSTTSASNQSKQTEMSEARGRSVETWAIQCDLFQLHASKVRETINVKTNVPYFPWFSRLLCF
jgi:hypothetical protein